jgi:ABC-type antimicrobial peptide transport system permease subunit
MNKKLLLLLFMTMFSFVLSAQTEHMKFAGIPLTGTIEQFQKKLVAKGFRINAKISQMLPVGTRSFVGTFAVSKLILLFTMMLIPRLSMEPRFITMD